MGTSVEPEHGSRDPWRLDGTWTTPVVATAQGWSMTPGIELLLAADVRVAAGEKAIQIAGAIATAAAPLGVSATLQSAHPAQARGDAAAAGFPAPDSDPRSVRP